MHLLWMSLAASAAVTTTLVLAGMRLGRARMRTRITWPARDGASGPEPPAYRAPQDVAQPLDVSAEVHEAMRPLEPLLVRQLAHADLALQPGLLVHAAPNTLRTVLSDVITSAVRASPCGHILITAGRLGPRVQVAVSDDGAIVDRALREQVLRGAAESVALLGGSLEINAVRGAGTTVRLRLPKPAKPAPERIPDAARSTADGVTARLP